MAASSFGTSAKACTRAAARPSRTAASSPPPSRVAVPQQGRDAFEAARGDQFLEGMAAHDQPARLAIDLAHHRVGHDHAVEAAIHPCLQHRIPLPLFAAKVESHEMYCQS